MTVFYYFLLRHSKVDFQTDTELDLSSAVLSFQLLNILLCSLISIQGLKTRFGSRSSSFSFKICKDIEKPGKSHLLIMFICFYDRLSTA